MDLIVKIEKVVIWTLPTSDTSMKAESVCSQQAALNFSKGTRMNKTLNKQKKVAETSDLDNYSREFVMANETMIPELELEWYQPKTDRPRQRKTGPARSLQFAWIGIGRCGSRLAEAFYKRGYPNTLAVDTSRKDLDRLDLPEQHKFLMQTDEFDSPISCGREAVEICGPAILGRMEERFEQQSEHFMICLGAGGRTGGAGAEGLIKLIRNYAQLLRLPKPAKRVGVLMTLPSASEARSKQAAASAYAAANELIQLARDGQITPLIIVDNEKIKSLCPDLPAKEYRPAINRLVADLFDTFNTLSASPTPYTSFDSMDYLDVLTAGGCTVMGVTEVHKPRDKHAVSTAIRKNLESSLLAGNYKLGKAKAAAGIILGGKKMMAQVPGLQDNINYALDVLTAVTGRAVVHRGIYEDDVQKLRVYTIISGLPAPIRRIEKLRK